MVMDNTQKSVLLVAMPFAGNTIPSIQLQILEDYLKQKCINVKSKHLYLKATEIYGLENYNVLEVFYLPTVVLALIEMPSGIA